MGLFNELPSYVMIVAIISMAGGISVIILDEAIQKQNITASIEPQETNDIQLSGEYVWVNGIQTPIEKIDNTIYDPTIKTDSNVLSSTDYNTTNISTIIEAQKGIDEITSWLDLIALIVAASIIMYLALKIFRVGGGY